MAADMVALLFLVIVSSLSASAMGSTLDISYYNSKVEGKAIPLAETRLPPRISLRTTRDAPYYSLLMLDTQSSSTQLTFVHYWIANIPAKQGNALAGDALAGYVPPTPQDADVHRYDFILVEQKGLIQRPLLDRYVPDMESVSRRYHLGKEVASTFFLTQDRNAFFEKLKAEMRMSASFSNPREIHAYLNKYVIGQERAKKVLSVAMFNHHLRIKALDISDGFLEKSNVLLVGPSGCGKTLLAQHLAKSCNLPCTIVDCASLVESGYVGMHADDIMKDLFAAAGNDVEKAQHGVVVLDEIDKLRKPSCGGAAVSRIGAQQALLKLIEGKRVMVGGTFLTSGTPMDSTNVLFIAAGAFCDIQEIIYSRMSKEGEEPVDGKDELFLLRNLLPRDLIAYGMIPELVGRIPVLVKLDPLSIESLEEAIKRSILKQYEGLFKAYKVRMTMTPEAIHEVAVQAMKQKTGARGLRAIMEDVLQEAMFEVPGSGVRSFVVTAENVRKEEEIEYQRKQSKKRKNNP